MSSYDGKVVFVSGGTSGINLGIARRFAGEGAHVAVMSRSQDKVDAAVAELGEHAIGFAADVREPDAVAAALAATAERLGPIDVLISGAAGNFPAPAATMSSNAFRSVVDIDLNGTFNVMRGAYEHLRKPGAAIINITAFQSWSPTPFQAHVCAAKAGIDQLTRTLAMEWGPSGVRINSIAPGPIAGTEGMRRLAPTPEAEAATTAAVPLGRYGTTDDIAEAALWLCSDKAGYVTGTVLSVDGGLALGGSSALSSAIMA
ncbi:SDR family oxidoreductase [Aeromicrobium stalagmiti]|uniref:SDR family oxidoreductase n=1 Tax=Aeromicrobium stalagmiti TaxID=2738988 RepID=UPI001568B906|nr:SDR family oxidoreductase [Aeromicrobium stalagmiti]